MNNNSIFQRDNKFIEFMKERSEFYDTFVVTFFQVTLSSAWVYPFYPEFTQCYPNYTNFPWIYPDKLKGNLRNSKEPNKLKFGNNN